MSKAVLAIGIILALCGCTVSAAASDEPGSANRAVFKRNGGRHGLQTIANPSAVVAAELAFAREAQDKGQWAAFRSTADDDAVMFVPQPVVAKAWLKGRTEPQATLKWQPYAVWMSCDGSLAVSKGAWQRPSGGVGYFTTVWKRQKDGSYRWVLDQGDDLAQPLPEPEMIAGQVADCTRSPAADAAAAAFSATLPSGARSETKASDDHTLIYGWSVQPSGARKFVAGLWRNGKFEPVVTSTVAGS